jgi:GntR family transcriptional regulator/MocR family aminotransferase
MLALASLDRTGEAPLQTQLYADLRRSILAGRIAAGSRLPPTRRFAAELGVSRNTVAGAYDRLLAEGYLEARVGDGTYVARALPDDLLHAGRASAGLGRTGQRGPAQPRLGTATASETDLARALATGWRAFHPGIPDVAAFPRQDWARLLARVARRAESALLGYGDPAGYRPLREAITAYLGAARGVVCDPDQVIVVAGSQQGIHLAARVLLGPGDTAAVEDPGYFGARRALRHAGARLLPIPVDADGIDPGPGDVNLVGARLAYVTPSHQFPLGATMSLARRLRLLDWARRTQGWIVEDDYDGEFRYAGRPLPALQGLDEAGRVVYVGTFSKVLAPGLRLGYLVAPRGLVDAFVAARAVEGISPPSLDQAALATFITDGHFGRHIRRMRTRYAERQQTLVDAVQRLGKGLVATSGTEAGIHLIGWLPEGCDDGAVARRSRETGVMALAVSAFTLGPAGRPGLVLGFAAPSDAEIVEAVPRLCEAVEHTLRRSSNEVGRVHRPDSSGRLA